MTRSQLLDLGLERHAIEHRIAGGRLHRAWAGVYAVGRPELTRRGRWMAAVLSCGPGAALSHRSAAALLEIRPDSRQTCDVSVRAGRNPRRPGIDVHRRSKLGEEQVTRRDGIPVTTPVTTLIDMAVLLGRDQLEAAINQADQLGLTDPDRLRRAIEGLFHRPGAARLREVLDRQTFRLTDSDLERLFLPLVRRAGLAVPETRRRVNGFKVDFYWRDLGLVVETDGLRYHRTPAQQAKDRRRDQVHAAAGLTPLRFTHAQVKFEPAQVEATLAAVAQKIVRPSTTIKTIAATTTTT